MNSIEPLFLARRILWFHPAAFLLFHFIAAAVAVAVLIAVANARGRSPFWALFGLLGIPGLLIGLLVLIALPVQARKA